MAELEKDMEEKLIRQLTQDVSQWTYRPDIRTEDELWQNFRQKLNQNNIDVLDGQELTDQEFSQVQEFIRTQGETPYKAALWLSGEHGIAQIPLAREDASLGTVYLMAINNREIAGGRSSYEVINQYMTSKADGVNEVNGFDRKRRFDVTLLINGMPMIHLELKNQDHPYMDAFRQIQKYGREGKFQGLFGLVQMFVVSNGTNTRYIAADTADCLNEQFLTKWVDNENVPVEDYLEFAKYVLSVPTAHFLVGKYSVLDSAKRKVILLRPYQIHAIEAIKDASRHRISGFIWHTTGSGKTLTSYKVTKNLLDIASIDKTIFLIDRKALDEQTARDFLSYAEHDDLDIDSTDNTRDLEEKLISKDRQALITTIQKLQHIIRRCHNDRIPPRNMKRLQSLRIAFVVDECHRTVSPQTKRELEQFFQKSLWYGFTGTPIFDQNKRAQKGDLARTTEQLFGPCLHEYTIKEAIKDKAVLGFQIEHNGTLHLEDLQDLAVQLDVADEQKVRSMTRTELEEQVARVYKKRKGTDFYDTDDHRWEVVAWIVNKSAGKFRLNAGEGNTYEAILTTGCIQEAQRYYELFKEYIQEGHVKERIRRLMPDFPKIAITYTVGENEDGATANQDKMKESLADYNAMFGTHFTLEDGLSAYNINLNARLARKESKYLSRDEQLDLVIVVDRLLTGFDAPCVSTLFVDRGPMRPQNLIQAFSRTNRLFNNTKQYGQIVTFRYPAIFERDINDALFLYSHGGTNDVQAPTYEETKKKFEAALSTLREVAPQPADVEDLSTVVEKKRFAKAYQELDHALSEIQVYTEWNPDDLENVYHLDTTVLNNYSGKYRNVIEELRHTTDDDDTGDTDIPIDVEYELESVKMTEINYKYLIQLIQAHIPEYDELVVPRIEDKTIDRHIHTLYKTNPKLAAVIDSIWTDLKSHPESYRGQRAFVIIDKKINDIIHGKIQDFSQKWDVDTQDVTYEAYHHKRDEKMNLNMHYDEYARKNPEGKLSKLRYRKQVREEAESLVMEEIRPLIMK